MWLTGALAGAAAGMVLWAAVAAVVIVVMAKLAHRPSALVNASLTALAVYAVTNPYVIYHLLFDRAVLSSNLGNTSAMYHLGRPDLAILRAIELSIAGAGPIVFIAGLIATPLWLHRHRSPLALLLTFLALAMAIPFIALAAGKPGEYGRFALLPDVVLLLAAVAILTTSPRPKNMMIGLFFFTAIFGEVALAGFIRDAGPAQSTSRWNTALELQKLLDSRNADYAHLRRMNQPTPFLPTIGLYADPAPYNLPPVDLNGWRIVRLPKNFDPATDPAAADVIIRPIDGRGLSLAQNTISWADKKFQITLRSTPDRQAYEMNHP
jgi:hypothetical protein